MLVEQVGEVVVVIIHQTILRTSWMVRVCRLFS